MIESPGQETPRSRQSRPRRWLASCLSAFLLVAVIAPAGGQGRPYRLRGLRGGELGPADLGQSTVIAVVWASWSPACRDIVPRVNAIHDRWGNRARVLMVDFQEDRSDVEAFLSGKQAKAPVYLDEDGAFSKSYSVTNLPGLVIVKDGRTVFSGKLPGDPDSLIAQSLG